ALGGQHLLRHVEGLVDAAVDEGAQVGQLVRAACDEGTGGTLHGVGPGADGSRDRLLAASGQVEDLLGRCGHQFSLPWIGDSLTKLSRSVKYVNHCWW